MRVVDNPDGDGDQPERTELPIDDSPTLEYSWEHEGLSITPPDGGPKEWIYARYEALVDNKE